MKNTTAVGNGSEDLVCDYLKANGSRILVRNYRVPCGELDIVALSADGLLCIIEVKTRTNLWDSNEISRMVGNAKRHRIKCATSLLLESLDGVRYKGIRFDVADVCHGTINYFEGAF